MALGRHSEFSPLRGSPPMRGMLLAKQERAARRAPAPTIEDRAIRVPSNPPSAIPRCVRIRADSK